MENLAIQNEIDIPKFQELMWPTLKALKELGGSATISELLDKIAEIEGFSKEIQNYALPNDPGTKFGTNCSWARSFLKKVGAIDNSERGVWIILDKGENLTEEDLKTIPAQVQKMELEKRKAKLKFEQEKLDNRQQRQKIKLVDEPEPENEDEDENIWKENLLSVLQSIHPSAFERLCQLLLRESGFTKVEVTGKSGDGGIDGLGILRVNLLSFHVSFQCKRYQGSVGSSQIRDFRGAMIGRGDKGLFITTGTFTSDARKEANRDGAPAIDLIDGQDLCELVKKLGLGVKVALIEHITIDEQWFKQI